MAVLKYFWGLLFLLNYPIFGQSILLTENNVEVPVGLNSYAFQDQSNLYSERDISSPIFQQNFTKSTSTIPNFGYGYTSIWLKIPFQNKSSKHWYFEIDNSRLNQVTFLLYRGNILVKKLSTGDSQPFSSYQFKDRNIFFDLENLEKDDSYTLYIQASSTEDLKFPMTFWEEKELYQHIASRNIIWGIYFGFILLIALYNFFLFVSIQDVTYLFYCLYVLLFGLLQADIYGFAFQYIWSNNFINDRGIIFFIFTSNLFLLLFLKKFWNLKNSLPFWDKIADLWFWFIVILATLTFFFYDWYFCVFGLILIPFMILFFFYVTVKLVLLKLKSGFYSLFALSSLMIASFIVILKNLGIVSAEDQDYYLMIGSMIEISLFSLALGDRLRQEQLEKLRLQHIRDEISANLHDDLAASLSSITIFSESQRWKAQKANSPNELIFSKISDKLRDALNIVRENAWEINPRNDQSEEWLDRMIKFATETLECKNIDLDLQVSDTVSTLILPIDYRRTLNLFFKEAINNVAKHSEAENVRIKIDFVKNKLVLSIKDDGKGFDINTLRRGNGMINFQSRADALRGDFKINASIGKGTELILSFGVLLPTNINS
ncbi:MAG: 7TM diverse intracellular signaling domain-containing protein [Arcicella sp.]|nr:7TM diverse intracellular signaling domain-containing protein [Arcicella sp.]